MRRISASSFKSRWPSLEGSVTYRVSDEELIAPIDVAWDADRNG